jgi:hypothetical protein
MKSGENIPNDLRNRPQVKLTLDPATIEALTKLGAALGLCRSRVVDRLVKDAMDGIGEDHE